MCVEYQTSSLGSLLFIFWDAFLGPMDNQVVSSVFSCIDLRNYWNNSCFWLCLWLVIKSSVAEFISVLLLLISSRTILRTSDLLPFEDISFSRLESLSSNSRIMALHLFSILRSVTMGFFSTFPLHGPQNHIKSELLSISYSFIDLSKHLMQ